MLFSGAKCFVRVNQQLLYLFYSKINHFKNKTVKQLKLKCVKIFLAINNNFKRKYNLFILIFLF